MPAFAPVGDGIKPGLLDDPVIVAIAEQLNRTPAQVFLSWAISAPPRECGSRAENFPQLLGRRLNKSALFKHERDSTW